MQHLKTFFLIFALTGCAYSHIKAKEHSGSPCLDGLYSNLSSRCSEVYSEPIPESFGTAIRITCGEPKRKQKGDKFHAYTSYEFVITPAGQLASFPKMWEYDEICADTNMIIRARKIENHD